MVRVTIKQLQEEIEQYKKKDMNITNALYELGKIVFENIKEDIENLILETVDMDEDKVREIAAEEADCIVDDLQVSR